MTATDIDVRWVEHLAVDNVEVRRHDDANDDRPPGSFDVVHERLVLMHVPGREQALEHMVRALGAGGWLLVEDYDAALQPFACPDAFGPEHERANKIQGGMRALLAGRGADLQMGRRLPRLLRDLGLADVGADAYLPIALPATTALEQAKARQTVPRSQRDPNGQRRSAGDAAYPGRLSDPRPSGHAFSDAPRRRREPEHGNVWPASVSFDAT